MVVCCCSLAGAAACQHCRNNPMATDVWTNKTVMVNDVEAKPFGNGIDVCPVCGKPSTIGKPMTNADRIRQMTDEELATFLFNNVSCSDCTMHGGGCSVDCEKWMLSWLKSPVKEGDNGT